MGLQSQHADRYLWVLMHVAKLPQLCSNMKLRMDVKEEERYRILGGVIKN